VTGADVVQPLVDAAQASRTAPLRERARAWTTPARTGVVIAVAQSLWLGLLLGRGWFSDADLARMADANSAAPNWHYLADPAGDHFAPGDRLVFWVLNRTAGVDWGVTVAARVVLAAAATLLLRYLLLQLVGPRSWLNGIVACFAFSPLLLPGLAWLTSGANLACAQVLVLLTLIAHVRYVQTGRLGAGVGVGVFQALALTFQDQAILTVPMLVLLSLGFLHTGSLLQRVRAALRRWVGWASLLVFIGAFGIAYESGTYNHGSSSYGLSDAVQIMWQEWTDVLAPALVAGPWRWWWNPDSFIAFANPTPALVLCGQWAVVVLVVESVRQTGWRAIAAWSIPVTVACGGVALAGFGRFDVLKTFIPPTYRYSFSAAVPLAVGITLAFATTHQPSRAPAEDADSPDDAVVGTQRRDLPARHRLVTVTIAVFVLGSIATSWIFDNRFAKNETGDYVANLVSSAQGVGPNADVYDAAVSHTVVPFSEPRHYTSDILNLAGVSVHYDRSSSSPLIVHPDGRLGPAVFLRTTDAAGPRSTACGTHLGGAGTWTIPLAKALPLRDWYVNLQTYQARPTAVTVSVRSATGVVTRPAHGSRVVLSGRLSSIMLRLPTSAPAAVVLRSTDKSATICVVHTYVGAPLPKATP
jgi:hypothetical protein